MAPSAVDSSQSAIHKGDGHFDEAQKKYLKEREKRIRAEGPRQFLDLYSFEKFRHFKSDPWLAETPAQAPVRPENGSQTDILIIGAGWAGLVTAVRLLDTGFKLEHMRIVDCAGGFGGTLYWNRYPGLNCDAESYIYMPLLEETGYVPTRKYVSGEELREHANRIAKKWNLDKSAWFQQKVTDIKWDDKASEWTTTLVPQLANGNEGAPISVRSRFTVGPEGETVTEYVSAGDNAWQILSTADLLRHLANMRQGQNAKEEPAAQLMDECTSARFTSN
ncbi:hypothetical protein QQX98_008754 [Neonectria punicea]|uniref:FAD/NAD(P)-binding domain-containing protein n=1 Tax=Neonectria punicea TaxID=979145 RepID=A0ABR1GU84_9HYPO